MFKNIVSALLLSLLFLSGCQSTSTDVITKLPTWVENPPSDTANTFYGIGNGFNIESANSAALKEVSSKLGVTVSSIYQQREQIANSNYQKYIDDQVKLSVEETPISKYQIVKNEVINGQVYSLVKVQKSQILADTQSKLAKENKVASKLLQKKKNVPNLTWWLQASKTIKNDADKAYRYASIINLLNPTIEINESIKPWSLLSDNLAKSEKNLCISLVDADNQSSDFIKAIKNSLSAQNIKITAQCNEQVFVSSTEQTNIIYEKYVSSNEVKLELKMAKKSTFASHSLTLTGQSVSNFTNARKGAVNQLSNRLKTSTIWQMLDIL